jgi:hypothetical protein
MPALEALLDRFYAAHTQPLGVSVDSAPCHANWGASLGGVSFPLLADFHPKGAVADSYGVYLGDKGLADRATIVVDAGGVVRYAKSVTPAGKRDMAELAAVCEDIDAVYGEPLPAREPGPGVGAGASLFVKSSCGFSRAALLARDNLHLESTLPARNVTDDAGALATLRELAGKEQAPCLIRPNGEPLLESKDIIAALAVAAAPIE